MQAESPMDNATVARRFRQIADILEIQGENPFKVRAYRSAADTIDGLDDSLADLALRNALSDLPGFGPAIESKTRDFLATGTAALWDRVRDAVPMGVVALAGVPGIGPKTARTLHEQLGVDSVDAAENAALAGKIRLLDGFGAAKEEAIANKIAAWRRLNKRKPRWRA
ncbi:MAG: helix-hairpin-helix domain-containing protein, partial [Armatimonadaceae bacterium]